MLLKKGMMDNLEYRVYDSREKMGEAAGNDIGDAILEMLKEKDELNIIFAAAPSQNETLAALLERKEIPWNKINAFHMDEYIGLDDNAPQRFGLFLKNAIFGKVDFKSVNYINSNAPDIDGECARYTKLLTENPCDIVCLGIGENGHIAFNDPGVADFNDDKLIKTALLDDVCRNQQVNDGCFKTIDDVPKYAVTLTCPTLFSGKNLFCIVPAKTKANAVKHTLEDEITVDCPATILRKHSSAILYLDSDSSELI